MFAFNTDIWKMVYILVGLYEHILVGLYEHILVGLNKHILVGLYEQAGERRREIREERRLFRIREERRLLCW